MQFPYSFWAQKVISLSTASGLLSGLLAYYKFEQNGNDSSSNGFNLTGASNWGNGILSSYCYSGSATQYLAADSGTNTSFSATSNKTFAFWIKVPSSSVSSSNNVVLAKNKPYNPDLDAFGEYIIRAGYDNATFGVRLSNGDTPTIYGNGGAGYSSPSYDWHFVVGYLLRSGNLSGAIGIILDNGTPSEYNYGSQLYADISGSTEQFTVGYGAPDLTSNFKNLSGLVDELGVWNRVLTSDEISQLWNNGNGKTYPF